MIEQRPAAEAVFAAWLASLAPRTGYEGDRAALAALRRGLGKEPGEAPELFPLVVPRLHRVPPWDEGRWYLVAALFGAHPVSWSDPEPPAGTRVRNLGASFAIARRAVARRAEGSVGGLDRRFAVLLASDRRELRDRLRQTVSLLRAHGAPVDWAQLLCDLRSWDAPNRWVQREWAREYWRPGATEQPEAATGAEAAAAGAAVN